MSVGVAVGAQGQLVFDPAGNEVIGEFVHLALGDGLELVDVDWPIHIVGGGLSEQRRAGSEYHQPAKGFPAIHLFSFPNAAPAS